jgi:hypothetical protein
VVPDVRRWRRWTWVVIAWTGAMAVLALVLTTVLGGICDDLEGLGFAACSAGSLAGTFIGLAIVGWAWLVGFLILAVLWFARRPLRRLCPPYGHPVAIGRPTCPVCGYDFLTGSLGDGASTDS